jgi:hypothetical protein
MAKSPGTPFFSDRLRQPSLHRVQLDRTPFHARGPLCCRSGNEPTNHPHGFHYSRRSTIIGSTREARRAGSHAAVVAIASSSAATAVKTHGSFGFTS